MSQEEKKRESTVMDMDMTPMIDITFQLISFFMFAINFTNDVLSEQVILPEAKGQPLKETVIPRVFININSEGTILLPGKELRLENPGDEAQLNGYLRAEAKFIQAQARQQGEENPSLKDAEATIIIRSHRASACGITQDVIRLAREAGFSTFSLRVLQPTAR